MSRIARVDFHHIGIPAPEKRAGMRYLEPTRSWLSSIDAHPFRVEWQWFEGGSPVHELIRTVPHVAFAVDDLEEALKGREILIAPTEPSVGVRVAFVLDDGAPVELLQFYTAKPVRPEATHAAEQRAARDDGTHTGMRRRK